MWKRRHRLSGQTCATKGTSTPAEHSPPPPPPPPPRSVASSPKKLHRHTQECMHANRHASGFKQYLLAAPQLLGKGSWLSPNLSFQKPPTPACVHLPHLHYRQPSLLLSPLPHTNPYWAASAFQHHHHHLHALQLPLCLPPIGLVLGCRNRR